MNGTFYRPREAVWPQRSPRRAAAARRLLAWVLAGAGAAAVVAGAALLIRLHPRFQVKRVVLDGVPEPRRAEVEALTDGWIGRPLLWADLDGAVGTLSEKPWVERVAARRVVPDTVVVTLAARPPVALALRGGAPWLVDRAGTWLGPLTPGAQAEDFVVIDPSGADAGASGRPAEDVGAARGAAFVEGLRTSDPELLARVSEVLVQRDGFTVVDRVARVSLRFGPNDLESGQARARWRALLALVPTLEKRALMTRHADLRFDSRIVLKAPAAPSGKT